MSAPVLPFFLPGCTIDHVHVNHTRLVVEAHTIAHSGNCPCCHQPSDRVHSRDVRTIRDLPLSESTVVVSLHVRRFFCRQPDCPQHTFAERLLDLVPFRGQRTVRFTRRLQVLANEVSAEAGARVATKSQLPISPDTLLRLLRTNQPPTLSAPRVLGVDDFALQKGRTYGTILVDLEHHRPIDLLPDRSAETLAAWLRSHPGVTIIARDRSTEYARGATLGAPNALQVADRWHVLQNHREALERLLTRLHADLARLPVPTDCASLPPPVVTPSRPLRTASTAEQIAAQFARTKRLARYEQVQMLVQQGVPVLHIARRLGMSRTTATKYATTMVFPERAMPSSPPTRLDPYRAYLRQRWAEGCTNASQLWRELHARGYASTYRQVARWAAQQRSEEPGTSGDAPPLAAPRQLVWLLLRTPVSLSEVDEATVARLRQHPLLKQAHQLAQEFQAMVRQREVAPFDEWLTKCVHSEIPELRTFAKGLQVEYASIRAALSEPWSSGQVEGQVTRLKFIKRQMYGRANFDLLRKRVLTQQ